MFFYKNSGIVPPLQHLKVLVVEDDATSREIVRGSLERLGYEVGMADNGIEALKLLEREKFHVVISDWNMPEMDGLELCKSVRARPNADYIYFILLTIRSGRENYFEAMDGGVDAFLSKPLMTEELEVGLRMAKRIFEFMGQIRKLEEHFQRTQKLESIGQLAGGIAHDFNNIMAVIAGYSELLLKSKPLDENIRKKVEVIQEAAKKGKQVTRRIQAFTSKQPMQMQVVNLYECLKSLAETGQRLISEKIEFITEFKAENTKIKVDPHYLDQAATNLILNALDAMPKEGKLFLEASRLTPDKEILQKFPFLKPIPYVVLTIRDTGAGMTQEVLTRAFEPFYTTKPFGKGSGLGLSTAYAIVKQCEGHIDLQSQPGKGTSASIYLPIAVDEFTPSEDLPSQNLHAACDFPGGTETILLVEDEEMLRSMSREFLNSLGYKVIEARDGQEALELYLKDQEKIHLLFTDVIMPRMNGTELAMRLKEIHPKIKVLFVSGHANKTNIELGLLNPGSNFMEKPFQLPLLAQKIREILTHPV